MAAMLGNLDDDDGDAGCDEAAEASAIPLTDLALLQPLPQGHKVLDEVSLLRMCGCVSPDNTTDGDDDPEFVACAQLLDERLSFTHLVAQEERADRGEAVPDGDDECPICLDSIYEGDGLVTSCRHTYHYLCLLRVFRAKRASTCPYCTSRIDSITALHNRQRVEAAVLKRWLSRGAVDVVFAGSTFYADKRARIVRGSPGVLGGEEALRLPELTVQMVDMRGEAVGYAQPYRVYMRMECQTRGVAVEEGSREVLCDAATGVFEHSAPALRLDPALFVSDKPIKVVFSITCTVGPYDLELGCEGASLSQYIYLRAQKRRKRERREPDVAYDDVATSRERGVLTNDAAHCGCCAVL